MNTNQLVLPLNRSHSTSGLSDHEYYGPLIDSYIKSILKSGLLLDEDLEVLLSISKFRHFPGRSGYKPSLSLLASIISALSSTFLAKKLRMPVLVIPPVVASVYFIFTEYRYEKRKRRNIEIIDRLLEVVGKIQKLTRNIIRYVKTRHDLGKTDRNSLLLHGKNVEEFMKVFLEIARNILTFLTNNLNTFTTYSPELQEDFEILKHLNYSNILGSETMDDIENCLACSRKVLDVNVLIFSKLVSYIGVVFNSQTLSEHNCSTLINETLPTIVKTLQYFHDLLKNHFLCLRHSTNKKSEIHLQNETGKRKHISAKLEATLISSVNNLSVILEKSQNILEILENEKENNVSHIGQALIDLKNHTFATYESLDLICRLYGILSNATVNQTTEAVKTPKTKLISSESMPKVSYDDTSDPVEERFELYIGADESIEDQPKTVYEAQSNAYLSLMLQELKQSLKQHERFVEAKKKIGDEDEDEIEKENIASRKERKRSPPKFDLNQLRDSPGPKHVLMEEDKKMETAPNLPAPPPPPLPSFHLNDLEEETGHINARSMLENIKVLSSQIHIQEDVFGDSGEDGSSSD